MNLYSSSLAPDQERSGFTLIELLVVIAIIAILAAILFPVFAQAKIAAKKTVAISNSKQLALGMIMYANDYDDTMSPIATSGTVLASSGVPYTWGMLLFPYLKNYDLFAEPIDGTQNEAQWVQNSNDWGAPVSEPITGYQRDYLRTFFGSWGYNYVFMSPLDASGVPHPVSTTVSGQPSSQIMFVSGMNSNSAGTWPNCRGTAAGFYMVDPPSIQGSMNDPGSWNQGWYFDAYTNGMDCANWAGYNAYGSFYPRYTPGTNGPGDPGKTTVSFLDGHVATLSPGQMLAGSEYPYAGAKSQRPVLDESKYLWGYGQ